MLSKIILIFILALSNYAFSSDFFQGYTAGSLKRSFIESGTFFKSYELTQPVFEENQVLEFKFHFIQAKKFRRNKLVIIFPSLAEETILERNMAFYFYSRGYDVLIDLTSIPEIEFGENTVNQLDLIYKREIVSVKMTLDSLEREYNFKNYFVVGASKGGIKSVSYVGHDNRIDAAWVMAAGGSLPDIYAYSEYEIIRIFRENHMRALNIDNQHKYFNYLKDNLSYDPLNTCLERRAKIYANITNKDKTIPTYTQKLLAKECIVEKQREIPGNHFLGFISQLAYKRSIQWFFESSAR